MRVAFGQGSGDRKICHASDSAVVRSNQLTVRCTSPAPCCMQLLALCWDWKPLRCNELAAGATEPTFRCCFYRGRNTALSRAWHQHFSRSELSIAWKLRPRAR